MDEIIVFTDGSYMKNVKGGEKSGYGIYFPNGELKNIGRPFTHKPLTNQRAELYAIFKALYYITTELNVKRIKIYTDSEYSLKSMTIWIKNWKRNNWKTAAGKPVKNLDIIHNIDDIMQNFKGKIEFHHVNSHTGNQDNFSIWNDEADKLAKEGAFK
mgnify:FL=1